ncbi:RNA recognition motif domain [Trinorchestia longiramus]|nr:RNA recognition motif domain [Trinorchestia longiramus]
MLVLVCQHVLLIDSNYVCDPPPLEVTIFNVNDNIDKQFLYNEIVCKHQCGPVEELSIYSHEFLHKHLGVARLLFQDAEAAQACVAKFNDSTLMGRKLHVFLDPFGKKCKERVAELSATLEEEAKKEEEAKEARKRPPPPPSKLKTPSTLHKEGSAGEVVQHLRDGSVDTRRRWRYLSRVCVAGGGTYAMFVCQEEMPRPRSHEGGNCPCDDRQYRPLREASG